MAARLHDPGPAPKLTAGFRGDRHAGDGRDRADPQARGDIDALLLPDNPHHRGSGRGWAASHHLPAGARRRRHGERLCPHGQRPATGRLCHAVWTWRGERLPWHRERFLGLRPAAAAAARSSARHGAALSDVQVDAHLRVGDEVGGGADAAGSGRPRDAPSLQPAEERPARAGHARSAGGCGEGRPRHGHHRLRARPGGAVGRRSPRCGRGRQAIARGQGAAALCRPGCSLRPGERGAAGAGGPAAGSCHDLRRRQERLPGEPSSLPRHGRHRLHGPWPPFPRRSRCRARRRMQLHAAPHHQPVDCPRKKDHPRHQRCARPLQDLQRRRADPRRCQAGARATDRGRS